MPQWFKPYPNSSNDRRISFNSLSVMPHNLAAASSTWISFTARCYRSLSAAMSNKG